MRELATIRQVEEIIEIPDADRIEALRFGGWRVIAKKGEFNLGDKAVFYEIDSFLPEEDERYAFLMQRGVKTMDGKRGHRLKTAKLRGVISQGLALPLDLFPELSAEPCEIGDDVSGMLGIIKYEPPAERNSGPRQGKQKGSFPWFIQKTDEERIQNVRDRTMEMLKDVTFVPTLKLDGSSTTVYYVKDEMFFVKPEEGQTEQLGLCSRNCLLKITDDEEEKSDFQRAAEKSNLFEIVQAMGRKYDWNVAIQAETVGPGIVRSWEKFSEPTAFVFSIYDIDNGRYVDAETLMDLIKEFDMPATTFYPPLRVFEEHTRDEIIAMADGPSMINPIREGLVFKAIGSAFTFKAISNKFLLKAKD